MVERQTPNLLVGGSNPSWPAILVRLVLLVYCLGEYMKNVPILKGAISFLSEVRFEMSRVLWPGRREFIGSTVIALVIIMAFSIYLGLLDFVFNRLAQLIF